jgi:hypothetical protein
MKPTIVGLVAVAACFGVFGGVSPASAQVDLSGMWAPIFHEDQIERAQVGQAAANSAQIIAHENVMKRMTEPEGNAKPATGLMPTDTFFTEARSSISQMRTPMAMSSCFSESLTSSSRATSSTRRRSR